MNMKTGHFWPVSTLSGVHPPHEVHEHRAVTIPGNVEHPHKDAYPEYPHSPCAKLIFELVPKFPLFSGKNFFDFAIPHSGLLLCRTKITRLFGIVTDLDENAKLWITLHLHFYALVLPI